MLLRRVFAALLLGFVGLSCTPVAHAQRVAIGLGHTCVITPNNRVRCMGSNQNGQLGDGTRLSRTVPGDVRTIVNASAIAAGDDHTCAITSSSQVWCWGYNGDGELGLGDNVDRLAPQPVAFPNGFVPTAVFAGSARTCVVGSQGLTTGLIYCWGYNSSGAVDGGATNRLNPALVPLDGDDRATAISLGGSHTCARTQSGEIQCWGSNYNGQLGRDTTAETAPFRPKAVPQISSVPDTYDSIASGNDHTCVIAAGTVKCWGGNFFGQLGNGSDDDDPTVAHSTPVGVIGLNNSTAVSIRAGYFYTCVATTQAGAGSIYCWGDNDLGQLGNGKLHWNSTPGLVNYSVEFGSSPAWSSGWNTNCVLDAASNYLRCWGGNSRGQFGNRMRGYSDVPRLIAPLAGGATASALEVGGEYACIRITDGRAQCWGYNGTGQIGDYTSGNFRPQPQRVGSTNFSVGTLAAASSHSCSTVAGEVSCWGDNSHGELGDGTTVAKNAPVAVQLLPGTYVVNGQISVGSKHSCALTNLNVQCWGENSAGQLGNGSGIQSTTPASVSLFNAAQATAIDAGPFHTCAVTTAQKVQCWGRNADGELGVVGAPKSPQEVPLVNGALAASVSAGGGHSCALSVGGHIQCWGRNRDGALGIGIPNDTSIHAPVPLDVPASVAFTSLSAGNIHSCAVSTAGEIWCWGSNSEGAIEGGSGQDVYPSPYKVRLLGEPTTKAISVGAGSNFTCALTTIGTQCWGQNPYGQLGNGEHGIWPTVNDGVDVMDSLFVSEFE